MATQAGGSKSKLGKYFKGVKSEFKKVVWPDKNKLINYTGVVILLSVIVSLIVYVLDLLMHSALGLIIQ
jgi:preprotein translocase subunit SecE